MAKNDEAIERRGAKGQRVNVMDRQDGETKRLRVKLSGQSKKWQKKTAFFSGFFVLFWLIEFRSFVDDFGIFT